MFERTFQRFLMEFWAEIYNSFDSFECLWLVATSPTTLGQRGDPRHLLSTWKTRETGPGNSTVVGDNCGGGTGA